MMDASSDEPMPLALGHGQTDDHINYWGQPMQQLGCIGIAPSFRKLWGDSIFKNILLVPLMCTLLSTTKKIYM